MFACFFIACDALVVVDPPKTELTRANVFSSDQSASSAVAGLYSQLITSNFALMSCGMTLYPGMSADEIYNSSPGLNDEFTLNSLDPFNSTINTYIWNPAYRYIYQANAIIEGLESSNAISESVAEQLKGEALFIRAFCYFYLVNLFGDVPFIVLTDYNISNSEPRMDTELIYDAILSDLLLAERLLKEEYPTNEKIRVNKWVAKAMLARVYLYLENYEAAIEKSTDLIDASDYNLLDEPSEVFLANSAEAIWQLRLDGNSYNTWEGAAFIPQPGVMPNFVIYEDLIKAFAVEDKRLENWIDRVVVDGQTVYFPYKYKIRSGGGGTEYYTVVRLAEQYLIRAEAYAYLDEINLAIDDLDIIRIRAGLESLKEKMPSDRNELLNLINQERRLELFCEWGHRWFDLNRTNRLDNVMAEKKDDWSVNDKLYPIPGNQLLANPALTQNIGY